MKNNKAWLLPSVVNPNRVSFCIAIPDEQLHIAAFWGALQELAEWWNWERDTAHTATQVAQVWRQVVFDAHSAFYDQRGCPMQVRQNPTDACTLEFSNDSGATWTPFADLQLCPPLLRMGADGTPQVSTDGGTTWQDTTVQVPDPPAPPTGQNSHCLSSRNATEVFRLAWLEVFNAWTTQGQIAFGVIAFVSVLAAMIIFPPAVAAVWEVFAGLWAVVTTLTGGEWTAAVTDRLTCIFLCNSTQQPDGSIRFNSWQQVLDDIFAEDIQANPIWGIIWYMAQVVGQQGTERAASTRSVTSYDCGACACAGWCFNWDSGDSLDNWTIARGHFVGGDIASDPGGSLGYQTIALCVPKTNSTQIKSIEITVISSATVGMQYVQASRAVCSDEVPDGVFMNHSLINDANVETRRCFQAAQMFETPDGAYLIVRLVIENTTTTFKLTHLRISGEGSAPFSTTNCQGNCTP